MARPKHRRVTSDLQFLTIAYNYAKHNSHDTHTQNGAVIARGDEILSYGANTFPFGVNVTVDRLQRPLKYKFMEHAERNAIYHAAFNNKDVRASTLYSPFVACTDCARAIIQSGIERVVGHQVYFDWVVLEEKKLSGQKIPGRVNWRKEMEWSRQMFKEAGVELEYVKEPIANPNLLIKFNWVTRRP